MFILKKGRYYNKGVRDSFILDAKGNLLHRLYPRIFRFSPGGEGMGIFVFAVLAFYRLLFSIFLHQNFGFFNFQFFTSVQIIMCYCCCCCCCCLLSIGVTDCCFLLVCTLNTDLLYDTQHHKLQLSIKLPLLVVKETFFTQVYLTQCSFVILVIVIHWCSLYEILNCPC